MTTNAQIDRQQYPELNLILWDTTQRYLSEERAFNTYETRWKYVDETKLCEAEKALIARLIKEIGKGLFLVA
ncbi:MAG: hypothetical protein WAO12_12360 [Venatoribacter sp.]